VKSEAAGYRKIVAGFRKIVAGFRKNVAGFENKNLQKSNTNLFTFHSSLLFHSSLFTLHFSLFTFHSSLFTFHFFFTLHFSRVSAISFLRASDRLRARRMPNVPPQPSQRQSLPFSGFHQDALFASFVEKCPKMGHLPFSSKFPSNLV